MKRRTPIRARSERRERFEAELDAITPLLEARSRGVCEICGSGVAIHRHHRLRRSQGGTNDLGNLLHLCRDCHGTVHAYPALSYEEGWLVRRPLQSSPYCALLGHNNEEGMPSMRTLTLHTADELAVRWKRWAADLDQRAADVRDHTTSDGRMLAGLDRERAQAYRVCATELQALLAAAMEMEAAHHGDPEVSDGNRWPGFCRECGRDADHRWHTEQGPGFLGDGMIPHPYAP